MHTGGQLWKTWDADGDSYIDENELLDPIKGLLAYVKREFKRSDEAAIPDIKTDKHAWFRFFDYDGSGTLEREEIVRALIKTFRLSDDHAR